MIIRTASFKNLHGHLNPSLNFQPGVNILIGVNGSGKTSILNALAWTLSPASMQGELPGAYFLSTLQFDEINVAYTIPGIRRYQRLKATRHEKAITIQLNGEDGTLTIPVEDDDDETVHYNASGREFRERADFITRLLDDQRDNPVLRQLNNLHGPLYLPLNRRWSADRESQLRTRRPRLRRHSISSDLPISDVLGLAEYVFRSERAEIITLNDQLRNGILTSLFEVSDFRFTSSVWTMDDLNERRRRVSTALMNLGLTDAFKLSEEYFERLESVVCEIGGQTIPSSFQDSQDSDKWFEWIAEAGTIAVRIERLIPLIEKYEADRIAITQRSTAFLDSVNGFFRDNGKEVEFLRRFDLSVRLPNGHQIGSNQLSSGELQLLVLFTFLYFQFDSDQEFVAFVDEPELSLHVAWQQRYVSSLKSANPNAQFIIATHSPEIAGPAREAVIDISPRETSYA